MTRGERISFPKAIQVLDKLLEGKSNKEAAYEAGVSVSLITEARKRFPLFLGLPRKYDHEA